MTGPEHYRAAEGLLAHAREIPAHRDETNPAAALLIAEAQAHATLALAAATAQGAHQPGNSGVRPNGWAAWRDVVVGTRG